MNQINRGVRIKQKGLGLLRGSLLLAVVLDPLQSDALGTLNGQAVGTAPEKLAEHTKSARNTEEDGVEVELLDG